MTQEEDNKLITGEHLMSLIAIESPKTLAKLRKEGLPHIRIGRLIRYNFLDVSQWMAQNKRIALSPTDAPMQVFTATEEPNMEEPNDR